MERLIKDYFLVTVLLLLNYIDEVVDSGFNVMGFVPILLFGIYNYSIFKTTTHRSARSEIEISDDYSYDVVKKAFKWDPGSLISSPVFIYTLLLGVELLQEGRQRNLAIFCFILSAVYYSMGVYLHVRRWRIGRAKVDK